LLDHIPQARQRAEKGELLFGTVDTFLLWKLTNGKVHATDATNASRTLLFNIHTQQWDQEILQAFAIPEKILPKVYDSSAHFGHVAAEHFGAEIPISSMIGDQQAAAVGQTCFAPGTIKSTYGTGCFILMNTDSKPIPSRNGLLTTIAYRLNNKVTYGLEASIFSAGSIMQWLRDKLGILTSAAESETLASSINNKDGVYLIPAFTGLGAPYWNPHARAAITGLSSASGKAQIVRAGLEAIAYQTCDLLTTMKKDYPHPFSSLRVDGGMAANNWLLQFIADMLNMPVIKPVCIETTALGAAYLAGLQIGFYQSLEEIAQLWQVDKEFLPAMSQEKRQQYYEGWQTALHTVMPL